MAKLDAAALTLFYGDYVDRWNKRDLEDYYSLYAEDLVFRDGSVVLRGVDALRDRYEAELRDHPDLTPICVGKAHDGWVGSRSYPRRDAFDFADEVWTGASARRADAGDGLEDQRHGRDLRVAPS